VVVVAVHPAARSAQRPHEYGAQLRVRWQSDGRSRGPSSVNRKVEHVRLGSDTLGTMAPPVDGAGIAGSKLVQFV
jgi:hypothetical protein